MSECGRPFTAGDVSATACLADGSSNDTRRFASASDAESSEVGDCAGGGDAGGDVVVDIRRLSETSGFGLRASLLFLMPNLLQSITLD